MEKGVALQSGPSKSAILTDVDVLRTREARRSPNFLLRRLLVGFSETSHSWTVKA